MDGSQLRSKGFRLDAGFAAPPPDKIIRFANGSYFQFPQMRWSVCHFQQLMPTKAVSRGLSLAVPLVKKELSDIDKVTFLPWGAKDTMTWQQSLEANFTDGLLVMHHFFQGKSPEKYLFFGRCNAYLQSS